MRVLICGSRNFKQLDLVQKFVNTLFLSEPIATKAPKLEIIVGDARGVDAVAAATARRLGLTVTVFKAAWDIHGRRAGMVRNLEMLDTMPHLIVAFWDGESPGTGMMVRTALKRQMNLQVTFDL